MVNPMRERACRYSFDDLHNARFGRVMTISEKQNLFTLSQDERNRVVGEWAEKAGWLTQDVVGDNGVMYRSFMPGQ